MSVTHTMASPGDSYCYAPGDRVAWGSGRAVFYGVVDSVDHEANTVTLRDPTRWERLRMVLRHPIRCLKFWLMRKP